jgi:hypothetical protein
MFNEVEKVFLDNILVRDLSLITNAIKLIDDSAGDIRIKELAQQLNVSNRTIRIPYSSLSVSLRPGKSNYFNLKRRSEGMQSLLSNTLVANEGDEGSLFCVQYLTIVKKSLIQVIKFSE